MDPLLVTALVQAGAAGYRMAKAQRDMNALRRQRMPSLTEAAGPLLENRRMYEQQYRQGLTPATRNLAQQQFASSQLAQQRAAMDLSGGQMSAALSRMNAANTGQFSLGLAAQNEAAQRAGMAGLAGTNQAISALQRADAAQRLAQRLELERNLGRSYSEAGQDIVGAVGAYGMGQLYKDIYGLNKKTPTTQTLYKVPETVEYNFSDYIKAPGPEFTPTTELPKGLEWGTPTNKNLSFSTPKTTFK